MTKYISVKTGNILRVKQDAYQHKGFRFSGLIDPVTDDLYDNPHDSLAKYLGQPNALEKGQIKLYTPKKELVWK